ncbi:MAG TPA: bifunctional diaminohydroxyphosphoribosylaminopyrimidine deaminase/5-amino-6-(5-phosphoribosylamino)uracil reductase RibD [Longimicrobiaceae bacterium]|nr:bifunctional diaminohydroxyphosphoribosylaminopyrimidine deaminase/5-amino-6-(5-phosphoribosylamino)uracil reductase RibD [Longimicrobiaceae bacterium]
MRKYILGLAMAVVASPAFAQDGVAAACAGVPQGSPRDACITVAQALDAAQPQVGIALAGGNPELGTASTGGVRLGILPRVSLGLRGNVVATRLPGFLADELPSAENVPGGRMTFPLPAIGATASVGLFDGVSLAPTLGGFGALDLLGSATWLPVDLVDVEGFDRAEGLSWGVGARLGLVRESFAAPGVAVSLMYRSLDEIRVGDVCPAGAAGDLCAGDGDPGEVAFDLANWSARATVGKRLLGLGLAAGVGLDRFESEGAFAFRGETVGTATRVRRVEDLSFENDRWSAFANLSYGLLVGSVILEAGGCREARPSPASCRATSSRARACSSGAWASGSRSEARVAGGDDLRWMRRALDLAGRGWGRVAPNPLVGSVVVRDGRVVGEGWHAEYGGPHGEAAALRAAGEAARGATVYVTLEPCSHFGKTPPCTDALIEAGVGRVVYAAADPDPQAAGGAARLRAAGIEVEGGVEEEAARDLNAAFFHRHGAEGAERPFLALKLALSLDAKVADRAGRSAWITGEAARAEVHRLRAGFDAVAVGIGTALADDPRLTVRGEVQPRVPPVRLVFDHSLRLPPEGTLARTARETPVWALCDADAPEERRRALEAAGVRVLRAGELREGLRALREAGLVSILVEGGAALGSRLLREGVVDRLYLFYAPLFLGPEGADAFAGVESPPLGEAPRWRRLGTEPLGPDTLVTLSRR